MTARDLATAIIYVVAFTIMILCGIHFAVAATPDGMVASIADAQR